MNNWLIRIDAEFLKQAAIQAVTFLIYFVVIKKFFYDKIKGIINVRKESIDTSMQAAKEANEQAEKLKDDYAKQLSSIEEQRFDIVKQAAADGEAIKLRLVNEGKTKAADLVDSAKAEIESEKIKAQNEFKDTIVDLSIEAAQKVVGKSLSREDHLKLINDSVSMLEEV